jgi:hypothetical protein
VRQLVARLFSPKRKIPILVVSQTAEKTGPVVPLPKLQEAVGPLAKVYGLSGGVLTRFNRLLDHVFGIEPTGVRLYHPGMEPSDPPGKHPIWNQRRISTFGTHEDFMELVRGICASRQEYQRGFDHANKLLSRSEADALFKQAAPEFTRTEPPATKHPRRNRKVLSVKIPKPSEEQVMALKDKFS